MRQSFVDLVEAVRALKLAPTGHDGPRCVRIGVDPALFPQRLLALQEALEAFDADGGMSVIVDAPAPDETEAGKLKKAMDAVFRWIRMQGLNTDEPLDLVAEALGGKAEKKKPAYEMLPVFTPKSLRKKANWKPTLSISRDKIRLMRTIGDHVRVAYDMQQVNQKLGPAALAEAPQEPSFTVKA